MIRRRYFCLFLILIIAMVFTLGCTTPGTTTTPGINRAVPVSETKFPEPTIQNPADLGILGTIPPLNAGGYTLIQTPYNGIACLDVQKITGTERLNSGEKYTLSTTLLASDIVNVNLLIVDSKDRTKLETLKPKLNLTNKIWIYEGIHPLVQINDLNGPEVKNITITVPGQYYLCADDRKETGTDNNTWNIPVKFTRII
jgi:hypothetical protein